MTKKRDFSDQISIKMEPELRHVLAHLFYALEAVVKKCPQGAMDNLRCVEGLVFFEGDQPEGWERYYTQVRSKSMKKCKGKAKCKGKKKATRKKACKKKSSKKCKGR
jgi:hypothetical protein